MALPFGINSLSASVGREKNGPNVPCLSAPFPTNWSSYTISLPRRKQFGGSDWSPQNQPPYAFSRKNQAKTSKKRAARIVPWRSKFALNYQKATPGMSNFTAAKIARGCAIIQFSRGFAVSPAARLAIALCVAKLMFRASACTDPSQYTAFQVLECELPKLWHAQHDLFLSV